MFFCHLFGGLTAYSYLCNRCKGKSDENIKCSVEYVVDGGFGLMCEPETLPDNDGNNEDRVCEACKLGYRLADEV